MDYLPFKLLHVEKKTSGPFMRNMTELLLTQLKTRYLYEQISPVCYDSL